MYKNLFGSLILLLCLSFSCSSPKIDNKPLSGINPERFDTIVGGKEVKLYTLKNKLGMEMCITNYGARIVSLMVPDRDGKPTDVVLGFDNIADYMRNKVPFGGTVGRCANRIRGAKFTANGVEYQLSKNDGENTLHGGEESWLKQIFEVKKVNENSIVMEYLSPDKESGYPGNVLATVTFTIDALNTLKINYHATTDQTTVINLTNHSYFCLTGDPLGTMMNSSIFIDSDYFTPKLSDQIPRGDIVSVEGTAMDFRKEAVIADRLVKYADVEELKISGGYGVNMIFNHDDNNGDKPDVKITTPESGIVMEIFTSQPSMQFYTVNSYDKTYTGKHGLVYPAQNSICFETQHYPDAVNNPSWPSPIINKGEVYEHHCYFRFSTDENK